ncbi:MAG: hypothetical protein ABSD89_05325 [Halobacteriota archaeon]|jgi:hypothetical protein
MAKFMTILRANPAAQWPLDPAAAMQWFEMAFAAVDEGLKTGLILEFGLFPDSLSGYIIYSGEAKDVFMRTFANYPWFLIEVHEIIDYETGKAIARQVFKAQAEAMAAMKR